MSDRTDPQLTIPGCAQIVRGSIACGAPGGVEVLLENLQPAKQVRATVRKTWRNEQGTTLTEDTPYVLEAGERRRIGCTSEATSPPTHYTHGLVGCQIVSNE
jgi:hypothetical protein